MLKVEKKSAKSLKNRRAAVFLFFSMIFSINDIGAIRNWSFSLFGCHQITLMMYDLLIILKSVPE